MTRRPHLIITDRPQRLNLANFEQRLRKLRIVFGLILNEIDEGLERIAADRAGKNDDDHAT